MGKHSDNRTTSERLAIVAFLIFIFFTLTAYGGSNTASFVLSAVTPEFVSLRDAAQTNEKKACIHSSLKDILINDGYSADFFNEDLLNQTDVSRLERLTQRDGCDAVVISEASLDVNGANAGACSLFPLVEDEVAYLSVAIPLSPNLGPVGEELKERMDLYISRSWYSDAQLNATVKYFKDEGNQKCSFPSMLPQSDSMEYRALAFPLSVSSILLVIAFMTFCFSKKNTHGIKTKHEELINLLESDEVDEDELNSILESNDSNDISLLYANVIEGDESRTKKLALIEDTNTVTLHKALKRCMTPSEFSDWLLSNSLLINQRKAVLDKIKGDVFLFEKVVLILESIDSSSDEMAQCRSETMNEGKTVKSLTDHSLSPTAETLMDVSDNDEGSKKFESVLRRLSLSKLSN